jgi:hypothetical protein
MNLEQIEAIYIEDAPSDRSPRLFGARLKIVKNKQESL